MMEDLYEREEKCLKAIKTVRKAVFMRILVAVLMVWMVAAQPGSAMVWGVAVFVMFISATGSWPLVLEWKKQKNLLRELIAQEEE